MRPAAAQLPLPRNAGRLLQTGKLVPGRPLVASFVGETAFACAHVFADSGRWYDWAFVAGLQVGIVVRPGVDAGHALAGIVAAHVASRNSLSSYPSLVDVQTQQVSFVVDVPGGVTLWRVKAGSPMWQQFFGAEAPTT